MSDETQDDTPKLPNFTDEERAWLTIKLIGLKPRELYDPFLELFPRLAEWADEHGMSGEDLKLRFSNRSYQINSERNSDFTGVMSNLPKLRILVFTDTALFYDMSSVEVAMKLQLEIEAALINPHTTEEELKLLKLKKELLDKQQKGAAHLYKSAKEAVKFDMLMQKNVLKEKTAEPDPSGQPKDTQTPGETNWAERKRMRELAENEKSEEYDEPEYE